MITDQCQLEYANAVKNLKISNQICAWLMDGVNKNKIERLFSETIAFRIRLKGTRFYGKITMLISDQYSLNFF